jgi:hypothetical protein
MDIALRYRLFCIFCFFFAGLWVAMLSEQPDDDDDITYFAPLLLVGGIGGFACFVILNTSI